MRNFHCKKNNQPNKTIIKGTNVYHHTHWSLYEKKNSLLEMAYGKK